jgi:carbonic anhydrase
MTGAVDAWTWSPDAASVINDVAFIASLAAELGAGGPEGPALEVAVIHHTKRGTGFLADPHFRSTFAAHSGLDEHLLAAQVVIDPEATVRIDVARLIASPRISGTVTVSGHVYDLDTGLVTVVVDVETGAPDTTTSRAVRLRPGLGDLGS